jgi:hypothetical protein
MLPSPVVSRMTASSHVPTIILLLNLCTNQEITRDNHLAFSGRAIGSQGVGVQFSHILSCAFSVYLIPCLKVGMPAVRRENGEIAL